MPSMARSSPSLQKYYRAVVTGQKLLSPQNPAIGKLQIPARILPVKPMPNLRWLYSQPTYVQQFDQQFNLIIISNYMSKTYVDFLKISAPKVICVGKNYLKHVMEMGGTEVPKEPMLFMKPWSSLSLNPHHLPLPISNKHRIDHELELGVFISKGGSNISKQKAMDHVGGYFLALDLTDRDFQKIAKQKGFPWTLAKGQDRFCPVSDLIPLGIDPYKVQLHLKVNGQTRQKDITGNMHFKIDDLISYCSQYISLTQGDLILTGTPEGVGAIKVGDHIEGTASLEGKVMASLDFKVTQ